MIIRLAKLEDEKKISKLIAEFRVELKGLKGIKSTPNIEFAKEEFKEYMEANFPIYVAEDTDKELLGYIVCKIDSNVVWAESIYVDAKARRMGVASRLYEKAEEIAEELQCETVYNWVHPNNHKMIPFLAKRGYNVLNLIEVRKPRENENLTKKIRIDQYEYEY